MGLLSVLMPALGAVGVKHGGQHQLRGKHIRYAHDCPRHAIGGYLTNNLENVVGQLGVPGSSDCFLI